MQVPYESCIRPMTCLDRRWPIHDRARSWMGMFFGPWASCSFLIPGRCGSNPEAVLRTFPPTVGGSASDGIQCDGFRILNTCICTCTGPSTLPLSGCYAIAATPHRGYVAMADGTLPPEPHVLIVDQADHEIFEMGRYLNVQLANPPSSTGPNPWSGVALPDSRWGHPFVNIMVPNSDPHHKQRR